MITLIFDFAYLKIEEDEVRDAVLVTDGDNEIGQVMLFKVLNFLSCWNLSTKVACARSNKFNGFV